MDRANRKKRRFGGKIIGNLLDNGRIMYYL